MVIEPDGRIVRTAVIYDGGFFSHVSDYYAYHDDRRARLDIRGLHRFVERRVADLEGADARYCRIVDAHYFRGRFGAKETEAAGKLLAERQFDEVLMRAGVVTHYLPNVGGRERGVDVWLAVEALELAILKRFDVIALVAGDVDLLPLVRKLATIGTRVALLAWDLEWTDDAGTPRTTRTSQALAEEATYTIPMSEVVATHPPGSDDDVDALFLTRDDDPQRSAAEPAAIRSPRGDGQGPMSFFDRHREGDVVEGPVVDLKDFGAFVRVDGGLDGFLHISEISERFVEHPADFLREGEVVQARIINLDREQERIGLSLKRV